MKLILGKKKQMTNIFSDEGRFVPVTPIEATSNYITQIRNNEKDGYVALQIGFSETNKANKPQKEQLKKANTPELRYLREIRITEEEAGKHKEGEKFEINIFNMDEKVNVISTSKGKGFQGVIKRHNFSRGPETHGSRHHREPGSIGAAYPQHIFKGQKLPGRMGTDRTTVKNLKVAKIDTENNLIFIKGAVPGPIKSLVMIVGQGEFEGKIEKKEALKPKKEVKTEEKTEKKETIPKKEKMGKTSEKTKKEEKKDKK